jgi:hypothetical protein
MVGYIRHVVFCDENEVMALRKRCLVFSVYLSQKPFHPVPSDCTADLPARRDADPGMAVFVGSGYDDEVSGDQAGDLNLLDPLEIDPLAQALPSVEPLIRHQTERRFRPLALLLLMTSLPPLVRIRTRKPCVRLRLVLCG